MTRPKLLDLFCCEGGAAVGYSRAGFDIVGVDLFKHKNDKGRTVGYSQGRYPFKSHQSDAIEFVKAHGHKFDVIHASPPCQLYSITNAARRAEYPDLIGVTREAILVTGTDYVIENVEQAAPWLRDPILLCGRMFGLGALDDDNLPLVLDRHRLFESNVLLSAPAHLPHDESLHVAGSYGGSRRQGTTPAERRHHNARYVRKGGYVPSARVQQRLLGIDWMTSGGMHQSIPPAYTEWLGTQLLAHIESERVA